MPENWYKLYVPSTEPNRLADFIRHSQHDNFNLIAISSFRAVRQTFAGALVGMVLRWR